MARIDLFEALPRPIQAMLAGAAAIVVVVSLAMAVRSPLDEAQALAAAFDGAPAIAGASASPTTVSSTEKAGAPPTAGAEQPSARPGGPAPLTTMREVIGAGAPGDPREIRTKLAGDLQKGNYKAAVADIDALMRADPSAAEDRDLRNTIVDVAMQIMVGGGPECDQLFEVMAQRMGTRGIDLLYELVTTRGGSRAARRAEDLLKDPAVLARGSPAMRVAYELRTAPCEKKPELFDRAKADGDGRSYGQLQLLNNRCGRRSGSCCMHNDPKLKETLAAMKTRLGQ